MNLERKVGHIIDALRNTKGGDGCTVFIGAGCSVTAGIPLAGAIAEEIDKRYPNFCSDLSKKTYQECMGEIPPADRRELIAEYVQEAKVNWAHIALAQLIKEGYVTRILTTNFDPLVIRACALLGVYPAVYDITSMGKCKQEYIHTPSVIYLHGQHVGFTQVHAPEDETEQLSIILGDVFHEAGQNRPWLIVGYSGANDPVFRRLADMTRFERYLYWVCYKHNEPADVVMNSLIRKGKGAFLIKGYDADSFFIKIAQELKCFPPTLFGRPFTHLDELLAPITPFPLSDTTGEIDIISTTRDMVRTAIVKHEERVGEDHTPEDSSDAIILKVQEKFLAGNYSEAIELASTVEAPSAKLLDLIVSAHFMEGNRLGDDAITDEDNAEALYERAAKEYEQAVAIDPASHQVWYNWGCTLDCSLKLLPLLY